MEQPQVVVIESTNSLLVNATPEQHVRIATIISYVDSETLKRAIPYVDLSARKPEAGGFGGSSAEVYSGDH